MGNSQGASQGPVRFDARVLANVAERLGHYVYLLVDPRDSRPFYVGKGVGVRFASHGIEAEDVEGEFDGRKVARIREIRAVGLEHEIWIVRYGMTKAEYTAVEGAVIDLLGSFPVRPSDHPYRPLVLRDELTNLRREDARGKGMVLLERLVDELAAPLLETDLPLLLITLGEWQDSKESVAGARARQGHGFKREWYDPAIRAAEIAAVEMSTSAWWVVNPAEVDRRGIGHAVAVHRGVTRALFEIVADSWVSEGGRHAFIGAPVLAGETFHEVIGPHGHRVTDKARGSQNPISYWPKPGSRVRR
jgi:hypothetical protein